MRKSLSYYLLLTSVQGYLFISHSRPFLYDTFQDIDILVRPLTGRPGSPQLPFPCKGHHIRINDTNHQPSAIWSAGEDVTFQYE
jgi:hypothetical protein